VVVKTLSWSNKTKKRETAPSRGSETSALEMHPNMSAEGAVSTDIRPQTHHITGSRSWLSLGTSNCRSHGSETTNCKPVQPSCISRRLCSLQTVAHLRKSPRSVKRSTVLRHEMHTINMQAMVHAPALKTQKRRTRSIVTLQMHRPRFVTLVARTLLGNGTTRAECSA